jgi:hypothetical protein
MDIQRIKELALANGFKLKEQASGNLDLNAYVYDFANAIEREVKAQAVSEGFVLVPKEPTPKMIDSTWDYFEDIEGMSHNKRNEFIYKAMIDEAQEPAND